MATINVELRTVRIPDFGLPEHQPQIGRGEYESRVESARARARQQNLDFLLVYGDREHFANVAFLTGCDPRFEEALLVIPAGGDAPPTLIVGNEGAGYAECVSPHVRQALCQSFSLLGQPRDRSPRLESVLRECGIGSGRRPSAVARIGIAGWKYADERETADPAHWLDAPACIADSLRRIAGEPDLVTNATPIFMHPVDGLRLRNSADQLAAFEFGAAHCSQSVRDAIAGLRPGISEFDAVQRMKLNGLPWTCHLMFSTGSRSRFGLCSPSDRTIERGDPFTTAFGLWGGLTARAGFVAAGESDLRPENRGYVGHTVAPYFRAAVAWYETIGIGATGGSVCSAVSDAIGDLKLTLNPGHYIHLDEWVHTPFFPGSPIELASGMLLQCDMIPHWHPEYHTSNIEDTIALADEPLRQELATRHPGVWQRISRRREFVQNQIGIRLKPEVLPFSNLACTLQPFALEPGKAMAVRKV